MIFGIVKYICYVSSQEEGGIVNVVEEFQRRASNFVGSTLRRMSSSKKVEESHENEEEDKIKKMIKNQLIGQKFKIMFVFFQVILLFQEVYLIQYPSPYIDFLAIFSFFELDLFTVAKMDCAISG